MSSRLVTLAIWLAAVAGALAWLLPLVSAPSPVPPQAVVAAAAPPVAGGETERLLGAPPATAVVNAPPPVAESRFKLLGVIAPRHVGASGLALISVDGQPARAVAVGREVDPGTKVLAVAHRRVDLGATAGKPALTLELPMLPEASRGRPGEAAPGFAPPAAVPPPPAAARQRGAAMFGPGATAATRAPGVPEPAPPPLPIEAATEAAPAPAPTGVMRPQQQ